MYFCVHNCMSPSNDYAAVACSNNNQAQLHTHVLVPYWSPDVWLGLELLRDIQFGLPAILNNSLASYQRSVPVSDNNYVCHECINVTISGRSDPKITVRFVRQWLNTPFWSSRSVTEEYSPNRQIKSLEKVSCYMVLKDYRLETAYLLGTIDSQDIPFLHTGLSDQEYSHPHVDDFWHWL